VLKQAEIIYWLVFICNTVCLLLVTNWMFLYISN